jgi:hypothetical protein
VAVVEIWIAEYRTTVPFVITLSNQGKGESIKVFDTIFSNKQNLYSHPVAAFFFIAFRLGAILTYSLGSIFSDNFTLIFVVAILLLAFDFWTVKNVSGRLLVGLRWWNEIQTDGSNKWVFESAHVRIYKDLYSGRYFMLINAITLAQPQSQ